MPSCIGEEVLLKVYYFTTGQRHKFTLGDFDECINLPNSPDEKHWLNAGVDPPNGLCVKIFENSNCQLEHKESNIRQYHVGPRPNCKNLYNLGYFGTRSIQKVRCPPRPVHPGVWRYFNDS